VRALEQTEAVRVRIIVPPELIIEGVAQNAGPCSIGNGTVDCDFGDMQFADQRDIFMSLRATQAGRSRSPPKSYRSMTAIRATTPRPPRLTSFPRLSLHDRSHRRHPVVGAAQSTGLASCSAR
jgi:hypothetical protein